MKTPSTTTTKVFGLICTWVVGIGRTYLAMLLFIPLLIFYVVLIVAAYSKKGERKTG
jgi:hypothetical protein